MEVRMAGDHEKQRVAEEIERLETRRAEVEARIERGRLHARGAFISNWQMWNER